MLGCIIFFYGSFIFLGLYFCSDYFLKFDLNLLSNTNFIKKLILSWFVFCIDYFYFFRTIFIGIVWYIYHIYLDLLIGNTLTSRYTITDLNRPEPAFEDDFVDEEMPVVEEKDFELPDFEYFYLVLRFWQIFRKSYLIFFICFERLLINLKKIIFHFLKNNFFFWCLFFLFLNYLYFLKNIGFEFIIKHYWELLLRARTYIFIILHQEYFFVWIYRFFNSIWWFELAFRGNKPYNEKEPSSRYYSFFLKFYSYVFLHKKDTNSKLNLKKSGRY